MIDTLIMSKHKQNSSEKAYEMKGKQWLLEVENSIQKNIANKHFSVTQLAQEFNISKRQFQRRIKKVSGQTPIKLIQEVRLQTAYKLFELQGNKSVKEVCKEVGVTNRFYFQMLYLKRFGKFLKDFK